MTTPFLAEFEVAAALWEPRLFPIISNAAIRAEDIGRYQVKVNLDTIANSMRYSIRSSWV